MRGLLILRDHWVVSLMNLLPRDWQIMSTEGSASEKQWYWSKKSSDERNGPVGQEQLEELAEGGNLEREDLVWHEGFDDWKEAGSVEEIEELFASPPPLPNDQSDEKAGQPPTLPQSESESREVYDTKADVEGNIKVSKYVTTNAQRELVLRETEKQLRNICDSVTENRDGFNISGIANTFGSINRSASGTVTVSEKGERYLVRAGINYTTSWAFWILVIILITTSIFWLLPIGFYFYHKKIVRREIKQAFDEVQVLLDT